MGQTEAFKLVVGDCRLPLTGVPAEGTTHRDQRFRFVYQGIAFRCHLVDDGAKAALSLAGDLGPMPFSAESAAARGDLKLVIASAREHLGDALGIVAGRILLRGRVDLAAPVDAVGLVSAITLFLVPWRPYLETIAVFLIPPVEASGQARLRSGWRRKGVKAV